MSYDYLFKEIQIGEIHLKNRIVLSPLTSNYCDKDGFVTPRLLEYYKARAEGGVGLMIVEGAIVSQNGRGFPYQLMVDRDELIPGLGTLADQIHQSGSKAILQIMHHGRQTRAAAASGDVVAPSAVPCPAFKEMPRELSVSDIKGVVAEFAEAARRAKETGFLGVELHLAHGYLLHEFISPFANKRKDNYGGSLENRLRIVREIVETIREQLGHTFPVFCRISSDDYVEKGITIEEAIEIAKRLEQVGVAAIDVSAGVVASFYRTTPPSGSPEGLYVEAASRIKQNVNIPVIAVGRIKHPEAANQIIGESKADLVALGRALIADPDWVQKAQAGQEEFIIPCIGCNICNGRSSAPEIVCTVNGFTGREYELKLELAIQQRKIAILGGGIPGLAAACILKQRGHTVEVFTSQPLGGLAALRARVPIHHELEEAITFYSGELKRLEIHVNQHEPSKRELEDLEFNDIIVAYSDNHSEESNAIDVQSAIQVLERPEQTADQVLLVGSNVLTAETALLLGSLGKKVKIISKQSRFPNDVGTSFRQYLLEKLSALSVEIEILKSEDSWEALTGNNQVILGDSYPSIQPAINQFKDFSGEVHVLGDAYPFDDLANVVKKATDIALTMGGVTHECNKSHDGTGRKISR
ncbi:hypothetical protein ELQ35_17375 [Peribacillus cavernae]|uniref:NADH:flavin oxidoreductase n=1 Tax=Peribacillus cavernae TaxID=1674310 RepID=A0A3S0TYA3_9BACI|nr:tRNA-dihydrouridine synthase [Peribacillus cavernae]MDQ0219455.1 2,4-dienoyl-CoA reductase-like NADH-dependent reductase (Old Yellow Enzyme family) [Peribacillus cavernae]RUQ27122.1 hypothetical protein ELQ35_17375 [Peribacillus cavernae]